MDYRDERGALRERVEGLEADLRSANEKLAARAEEDDLAARARAIEQEIAAMRARLGVLEGEIAALRGASGAARESAARDGTAPARDARHLRLWPLAALAAVGVASGVLLVRRSEPPRVHESDRGVVATPPAIPTLPTPLPEEAFWSHAGVCFVDGTEPGSRNLVVLARSHRTSDLSFRVTVFDGATGQAVWIAPQRFEDGSGTGTVRACLTSTEVLVASKQRDVRLFDGKTGAERWSRKTPDLVSSASLGDRCVALALIDGTTLGLALATGTEVACSAPPRPRERSWLEDRGRAEVVVRTGDETVTLRRKPAGTPMLKVVGSGRRAWERDLEYKALQGTSPGLRLLIAGDVAITLGESPTREGDLTLLGVSVADGSVVFANHLGVTTNAWTPDFLIEAGRLYLSFGGQLRAYDPSTGAEIWRTH